MQVLVVDQNPWVADQHAALGDQEIRSTWTKLAVDNLAEFHTRIPGLTSRIVREPGTGRKPVGCWPASPPAHLQ
jgi:hypothetical protein